MSESDSDRQPQIDMSIEIADRPPSGRRMQINGASNGQLY